MRALISFLYSLIFVGIVFGLIWGVVVLIVTLTWFAPTTILLGVFLIVWAIAYDVVGRRP